MMTLMFLIQSQISFNLDQLNEGQFDSQDYINTRKTWT